MDKSLRKPEGAEEIELQETNERSVSDKTEQLQESTLTKSCKESETTSLENSLGDSWEMVEPPDPPPEPEKLQIQSRSSPAAKESSASFGEEKPEGPVIIVFVNS